MSKAAPKIFILAGESSGDFLGARLIEALKAEAGGSTFLGVGGPLMEAAGLGPSLFNMSDLSLFGFTEVIPKIPLILKRLAFLEETLKAQKPDVIVTIDVPGFSKRLIKRAKKYDIPCLHYVAPTVWVYRPGRAKTWANLKAHLLTLFSFEPPYFEKHGGGATFVGHPITQSTAPFHKAAADGNLYMLVLPGSRAQEIARHGAIFKETLINIHKAYPNMVALIPTFEAFKPALEALFKDAPFQIKIALQDEKHSLFERADFALVASGTATLEVALANIPMIIAYKVNAFTAFLIGLFIRVKHVGLANLLADNPCVPELLQNHCNADELTVAMLDLIANKGLQEKQRASFHQIMPKIQNPKGTPSAIAAKTILSFVKSA